MWMIALVHLLFPERAYGRLPKVGETVQAVGTSSGGHKKTKKRLSKHRRIVIVAVLLLAATVVGIIYGVFCKSSNDGVCVILDTLEKVLDRLASLIISLHLLIIAAFAVVVVLVLSLVLVRRRGARPSSVSVQEEHFR